MPDDLRIQQRGGLWRCADFFQGEERTEPPLPEAEAALDFAFGMGVAGDKMGHAQAAQGTLELAQSIVVLATHAADSEGSQAVGVEGFGQAVGLDHGPHPAEVLPGGFAARKTVQGN